MDDLEEAVHVQTFNSRKYAVCCGECGLFLLKDLEMPAKLLEGSLSRVDVITRCSLISCNGCDEVYCSELCKNSHSSKGGHHLICPASDKKAARAFWNHCQRQDAHNLLLSAAILAAELASMMPPASISLAVSRIIDNFPVDALSISCITSCEEDISSIEHAWALLVSSLSVTSVKGELTFESWLQLVIIVQKYSIVVGEESHLLRFFKEKGSHISNLDRNWLLYRGSLKPFIFAAIQYDEQGLNENDLETILSILPERAYSRLVQNCVHVFKNR